MKRIIKTINTFIISAIFLIICLGLIDSSQFFILIVFVLFVIGLILISPGTNSSTGRSNKNGGFDDYIFEERERNLENKNSETDIYPYWKDNKEKNEIKIDKWDLDILKALEWKRFEEVVAEYFDLRGYKAETTKLGKDEGVDVKVYGKESGQLVSIVQCKAWNTYKVKLKEVRELLGAVAAKQVKQGIFITTSEFTRDARDFAKQHDLVLIDGREFLSEINSLEGELSNKLLSFATKGDYWIPSCPKCGIKMTERRNKKNRNKFWGCPRYPRCWGRLSMSKSNN